MRRLMMVAVMLQIGSAIATAGSHDWITMPYGQKVFVSGINVAWKQFGGDVGNYPIDTTWFATMLQGVADSGGNAVRWWLFTDCSNDPQFDSSTKLVKGLGTSTVANIRKVLDMGFARGVGIDLCLLSFDMMKTGKTNVDLDANRMILKTDSGRKAFIDNAVVPLVEAIGKHPAIVNWEIFNEPEGMVKSIAGDWGNMSDSIEIIDVQKMVNQAAGAIHRAVPGVPVSNGCWSFIAGSNTIDGDHNYYSDSALIAAGGDLDGTLDYYMVHYYEWAKTERSPFCHPASYWGLDKPLVIGEFPAKGLSDSVGAMTPAECYSYLIDNGYAGAMGWTYTAHDGFGGLPEAGQGMRALETSYASEVILDFPPVAQDDWYADTVGKVLTVAASGVLVNDCEPTSGQTLSASVLVAPQHGTLALKDDGSFTYTPVSGWVGTDCFTYAAVGGGDAADTATVSIRVLDPSTCTFFAPPLAKDWKIYAGWGTVSVTDLPTGMGMNNSQWGSPATWIVGTGVPITVSSAEQTISVLVKNDAGSPWGELKFHIAAQESVGNYGPTDTTTDFFTLTAQSTGNDGFTEYRGTFVPNAAGTYLPSLQFVWNDTDGNGPNSTHQSVVRDIEICPTASFVKVQPVQAAAAVSAGKVSWVVRGQTVRITAPGTALTADIRDLQGRLVVRLAGDAVIQCKLPSHCGILVATVKAGKSRSRFVIVADRR